MLLAHDPLGCCALRLPGLKKLLGKRLQLSRISSGLNSPIHPLHFKTLRHGHRNRFLHHTLDLKTSLFLRQLKKDLFHLKRNIRAVRNPRYEPSAIPPETTHQGMAKEESRESYRSNSFGITASKPNLKPLPIGAQSNTPLALDSAEWQHSGLSK